MEGIKELKLNNKLRKGIVNVLWDAKLTMTEDTTLLLAVNLYGYRYNIAKENLTSAGVDVSLPIKDVIERYDLEDRWEKKSKRMEEQ